MNFEDCCIILNLTEDDLGIPPALIAECTTERLERDVIFFIKRSFRKQALKLHPDMKGNPEDFRSLLVAYGTAFSIVKKIINNDLPSSSSKKNNSNESNINFSKMRIDELTNYMQQHYDTNFYNNFSRAYNREINEFTQLSLILNSRLEEDYNQEKTSLFRVAFEAYLKNSDYYYKKYQDEKYHQYSIQWNAQKAVNKKAILEKYKPAITQANNLMKIGLALFFLVIPLVLSLVQWHRKRNLIRERDQKLTQADCGVSRDKWMSLNSDMSKEQWQQLKQYKIPLAFQENAENTIEGSAAIKSASMLKEKLILKQQHNRRLYVEVQVQQREVASAEGLLYYNLFSDYQTYLLKHPEVEQEEKQFSYFHETETITFPNHNVN